MNVKQMQLDLFPVERKSPEQTCVEWFAGTWKMDVSSIASRVYATMQDPFERMKVLVHCRNTGICQETMADICGVFTATDYHTCWDRAWALSHGLTEDQARRVSHWDYAKREPVFIRDMSGDEREDANLYTNQCKHTTQAE